jgi:hypothetical protein
MEVKAIQSNKNKWAVLLQFIIPWDNKEATFSSLKILQQDGRTMGGRAGPTSWWFPPIPACCGTGWSISIEATSATSSSQKTSSSPPPSLDSLYL